MLVGGGGGHVRPSAGGRRLTFPMRWRSSTTTLTVPLATRAVLVGNGPVLWPRRRSAGGGGPPCLSRASAPPDLLGGGASPPPCTGCGNAVRVPRHGVGVAVVGLSRLFFLCSPASSPRSHSSTLPSPPPLLPPPPTSLSSFPPRCQSVSARGCALDTVGLGPTRLLGAVGHTPLCAGVAHSALGVSLVSLPVFTPRTSPIPLHSWTSPSSPAIPSPFLLSVGSAYQRA